MPDPNKQDDGKPVSTYDYPTVAVVWVFHTDHEGARIEGIFSLDSDAHNFIDERRKSQYVENVLDPERLPLWMAIDLLVKQRISSVLEPLHAVRKELEKMRENMEPATKT